MINLTFALVALGFIFVSILTIAIFAFFIKGIASNQRRGRLMPGSHGRVPPMAGNQDILDPLNPLNPLSPLHQHTVAVADGTPSPVPESHHSHSHHHHHHHHDHHHSHPAPDAGVQHTHHQQDFSQPVHSPPPMDMGTHHMPSPDPTPSFDSGSHHH